MKPFISLLLVGAATLAAFPALAIDQAAVERTAPNSVVISWKDKDPVDVYRLDRPDQPIGEARLVSAADRDGRHALTLADGARPYFLLKDGGDKSTVKVAERLVPLEQGSNFRDIGGYPAAGGKHVKWGRIYRSGATAMLTDRDIAAIDALGIGAMVDLRSVEERQIAPTRLNRIPYNANDYSMRAIVAQIGKPRPPGQPAATSSTMYSDWLVSLAPQYRMIFDKLLAGDGAVSFNCSAGQDRTGVATALVLSALGVPRDVIYADYHLSTRYRQPQNELPPIDPAKYADNPVALFFAQMQASPQGKTPQPLYEADGKPKLAATFAAIDRRWGSVDRYLDEVLGIDAVKLASLRADYLE